MERPTDIKAPTPATLAKYGLTADEWWAIMERQGYRCPIMNQPSGTGRYVIDHEHVRGWKKMPPEERRQHVRGVVSWFANHSYLGRGISVERALRVALYLARYDGDIEWVEAIQAALRVVGKRENLGP